MADGGRRLPEHPGVALAAVGVLASVVVFALVRGKLLERREARLAELSEALDVGDQTWALLEAEQGFSTRGASPIPLVTPPVGWEEARAPWMAVDARRAVPRGFDPSAKGALFEHDGQGLTLSSAHVELPDRIRAELHRDVQWVAFVRRAPRAGVYERGDEAVRAERADVRLTLLDGTLLALGTCEAVPPLVRSASSTGPSDAELEPETIAELVTRMLDAARAADDAEDEQQRGECLASEMPDKPAKASRPHPLCAMGATPECLADCDSGGGPSCTVAAHALSETDPARARELQRRGCALGNHDACVQWALATRSHRGEGDESGLACAARVFERACDAEHRLGCGMFGFALARGAGVEPGVERARDLLESSCSELGGAPCFALGVLRRDRVFGEAQQTQADAAFSRACATGYTAACD